MVAVQNRFVAADLVCNCNPDTEGFLKGLHKAGCHTSRACYPEVVGYQCRGVERDPPELPDACPCCGAPEVKRGHTDYAGKFTPGMSPYVSVEYACGGSFDPKPQIQNHTDYWWGLCGLRK